MKASDLRAVTTVMITHCEGGIWAVGKWPLAVQSAAAWAVCPELNTFFYCPQLATFSSN